MTELRCAACGATQRHNVIRCEQCGKPLVFVYTADEGFIFVDPIWPKRLCIRCGKPYRGPTVYCSLECALADA